MSEELNIGDYVRTLEYIRKIRKIKDNYVYCDIGVFCFNEIIKSSPNIIDLIEVGDLIKLYSTKQIQQVLAINDEEIDLTDYVFYDLKKSKKELIKQIEWVITHEQIEQLKYKIGE